MNRLNIGIIGAGIIARNHLEAAESIPEVKLMCIADVVFERAHAFGTEFNIRSYRDYRQRTLWK